MRVKCKDRGCEWLYGVYLEGPFEFPSSQTAPGSFCRLHVTVTQGYSPKEPQPNRPSEQPKPNIARLTRMASSSSPSQRCYASASFRSRRPRNLPRPVITHAQSSRPGHVTPLSLSCRRRVHVSVPCLSVCLSVSFSVSLFLCVWEWQHIIIPVN